MDKPRLLYNGGCPVCAGGADAYRKMAGASDACPLVDVRQKPDELAKHGLTLKDVMYRVHFVEADGTVLRGVPAMAALWSRNPHFHVLGYLVRLPVLRWIAAVLYEIIAAPLYAWNVWREKRSGS